MIEATQAADPGFGMSWIRRERSGAACDVVMFDDGNTTMDDGRIWGSEEGLWIGDAERYRASIDDECLMVLPTPPFVMSGQQAVAAVTDTPRWSKVTLSERQVARPQEGLIVIAYKAVAERDGLAPYHAHCTTTYRRLAHEQWRVVQHQQTPPLMSAP